MALLGKNIKKPRERVIRPMAVGTTTPAYGDGYVVPTLFATRLLVRLRTATPDAGEYLMRAYDLGEDGVLYPLTIEDGTITVVAGLGSETDVDTAVKRFLRTNPADGATYELDVETKKAVVLYFAASADSLPAFEVSVAWKLA